jgi:uncharacterized protein (DUF1778 family)
MSLKSKPMDQVRPLPAVTVLEKEATVRINLNVTKSLRHQWKMAALQQKLTLTDLILREMSKYSNEEMSSK